MKRLFSTLSALVIILLGLLFAVLNSEPVILKYYLGDIELPLSLLLVAVLAFGALLGVLSTLGMMLRLKRECARLRKSIKVAEKEVANLRALPIKDKH